MNSTSEAKMGVYYVGENEKRVSYLCPKCKNEVSQDKDLFYRSYPISVKLCKSCCKNEAVIELGGFLLPYPQTENDYQPLLRFYDSHEQR